MNLSFLRITPSGPVCTTVILYSQVKKAVLKRILKVLGLHPIPADEVNLTKDLLSK